MDGEHVSVNQFGQCVISDPRGERVLRVRDMAVGCVFVIDDISALTACSLILAKGSSYSVNQYGQAVIRTRDGEECAKNYHY